MNLICSFLFGFYMLAMATTLIVCSSIYLWNLYEIDAIHYNVQCSYDGTFVVEFQSSTEGSQNDDVELEEDEILKRASPPLLCRYLKWWKLFAIFGLICGFSYALYLFSEVVLACHYKGLHGNEGHSIGRAEEAQTTKLMISSGPLMSTKTVKKRHPKCLSILNRTATYFLILATSLLSFGFVFLGSRQMALVPDGKGAQESWPPFILYVCSIWHLILLVGSYFLIIL